MSDTDDVEFTKQELNGKEELVLRCINDIRRAYNSDWHGGYWTHTEKGAKTYVPSQRKIYVNAVQNLALLSFLVVEHDELRDEIKTALKKVESNLNNDKALKDFGLRNGFTANELRDPDPETKDAILNSWAKSYQEVFEVILECLMKSAFLEKDAGLMIS